MRLYYNFFCVIHTGLKLLEGAGLNRAESTRTFEAVLIVSAFPILNILSVYQNQFERVVIVMFYVILFLINLATFYYKNRYKLILVNEANRRPYLNYLSIIYASVSIVAIIYTGV